MSANIPFISIILQSYNYAKYLPRSLDAIKRQTYKDIEVILVNNGSTDNSQEVIEAFVQENPDIRATSVLVPNNQGIAPGRNAGLAKATGKYVLFHDADDWMADGCLAALAELASKTDADKVFGSFREVTSKGKTLRVYTFCENQSKWFTVSLQATLYKRSIVEEHQIEFKEHTWLDDLEFNTFFNVHVRKIAFTNELIYNYAVSQYSTSGAQIKKKTWSQLDLQQDMLTLFVPLLARLEGKDKADLYYIIIKQYYFFMLHANRYATIREVNEYYRTARDMMRTHLPDYLRQKGIASFQKNGDRRSGRLITGVFYTAERLRCIKVLLWLFLGLSKITYAHP